MPPATAPSLRDSFSPPSRTGQVPLRGGRGRHLPLRVEFRLNLAVAGMLATAALSAGGGHALGAAANDRRVFPYEVHSTTLGNGLKVVVIPFDSPGAIAYFTVVRTGSRDEVEPGHSGFAHFFEHMMFRGTERYPAKKYSATIKGLGGDANASTFNDYTQFYISAPAAGLDTIMDMESDRFMNLKYSEPDFRTESLAVLGEYNKNASSPSLPLEEKLAATAFTRHTYQHTTMGFLADIKAMPGYYDYSLQFFHRFYRPENCTVLVVGDAQPERVFALARRRYGDWQPGYRAPAVPAEPPQTQPKRAQLDWPNPTRPRILIAYHVPALSTRSLDSAALRLIAQLAFGESSALYRELVVDKQWVDSLDGDPGEQRDPSLFVISASVKAEDLLPKVQEAIERALAELQAHAADPERLARIKSHERYDFAIALTSPLAVANVVASFIATTGAIDSINEGFEQLSKASPDDVQRMARQVFRPENQTVLTIAHHPPGQAGRAPGPSAGAAPGLAAGPPRDAAQGSGRIQP